MAEIRQLLLDAAVAAGPDATEYLEGFRNLADPGLGLLRENYPDDRGIVLTTRRRLKLATAWYLPTADEGEDDRSRTSRETPIHLVDHTPHVRNEVNRTLAALPLKDVSEAFRLAADLHDLGKADERFQAMLRRTDRTDAWLLTSMESALLAKSDGLPRTPRQRKEACERAGLPNGFRHEMLSLQIAQRQNCLPARHSQRDLILHLIAAHHGYARPFAPVVIDDDPPDVEVSGTILTGHDRLLLPPHRVDSGIAERFWKLTRRYGWWGLAYLEAVLRLADQRASADEDARLFDSSPPSPAILGAQS